MDLGLEYKGDILQFYSSIVALAKRKIVKRTRSFRGNVRKNVFSRQFYFQLLQQLTSTGFCVPSVLGVRAVTPAVPKPITILGYLEVINSTLV